MLLHYETVKIRTIKILRGHKLHETEPNIHQVQRQSGALPPSERHRYNHVSRVVQRPVPQHQTNDPREFQIQQLRRRFSPQELLGDGVSKLRLELIPSDPDFPFEIDALKCIVTVPFRWPAEGKPSLTVTNSEIARGYQLNVEKGFDALVNELPNATLLSIINALDKRLETFLSVEKVETVKLVANQGHAGKDRQQSVVPQQPPMEPRRIHQKGFPDEPFSGEVFTAEQMNQARAKRETETWQLEARLKRAPCFSKSSDGTVFTIPLEPRRRGELPVPLQAVQSVNLVVPSLYNLQPCRIHILEVTRGAARWTEQAFERRAKDRLDLNLMEHVNFLSQNMHVMATELVGDELKGDHESLKQQDDPGESEAGKLVDGPETLDDRNHVQIIPRPPEWDSKHHSDHDSEISDSSVYDPGDESGDDDAGDVVQPVSEQPGPERGILLSFPFLELHGIETLELATLGITVKCLRCKDTMDIGGLGNKAKTDPSQLRTQSCKKCANVINLGM
ncbi:MAG: hypothetical protein M1835_004090 [Candelina submexicana]|nr:MAG: hypothetical protein M1835_004090 [Candelina submexicana]